MSASQNFVMRVARSGDFKTHPHKKAPAYGADFGFVFSDNIIDWQVSPKRASSLKSRAKTAQA